MTRWGAVQLLLPPGLIEPPIVELPLVPLVPSREPDEPVEFNPVELVDVEVDASREGEVAEVVEFAS